MNKHIFFVLFAIANIVFSSVLIRFCETGPVASGAYRLLLTIPMLLAMNGSNKRNFQQKLTMPIVISSCCAGLFFALDLAVFNVSIIYTSLAESTLLTNMVPFVIAPISIFWFKEKIPLKFLVTVLLAIVGLYFLMSDNSLSARHLTGDWLALLSAVFYALFLTSIKTAREAYPASMVMIMVCIVGGILLMLLAIYKHEVVIPLTHTGWIVLVFVAFNGQVLGQTLLAYSVKYIPLQLTSIFLLLSPIFAAVYAYVIFHETLHAMQILGIGVILAAVYYGKQILEKSLRKDDF